jgi:hypothetical protein
MVRMWVLVHCGAQVGETDCDCERAFSQSSAKRGRRGEGSFRFGTELRWVLILVSLSPVNSIQFDSIRFNDDLKTLGRIESGGSTYLSLNTLESMGGGQIHCTAA